MGGMKAFTQKNFGEKAYNEIIEKIQQNKALLLIAMSRYLGFKEKRMNDFLDFFDEIDEEFSKYARDDVADEKILQGLEECGINSSRIFEQIPTLQETDRKQKAVRKVKMSLKEASEMADRLAAMREFMGGVK